VSIRSTSVFTSRLTVSNREAQAKRGEEAEVHSDQFQDPDNEYGLFAGTTYEQDDEEADKVWKVDENMDARRRARRCVHAG
jgi:pre-mRNA-processing factor 6